MPPAASTVSRDTRPRRPNRAAPLDETAMANTHVFISHSSRDDAFVKQLREALEGLGVGVWVDSRNLRGGSKLAPEIEEAIEGAHKFVVVLSKETVESPWVRREIRKALEVERRRKAEGYSVIPLLVGVGPAALETWFGEEPAWRAFEEARDTFEELGEPSSLASVLHHIGLQNQRREGMARNNLGNTLIRLGRYNEARREMLRAVECDKPYGHVGEPWKTWQVLRDLELAVGDAEAAARARENALRSYLAYRRDGGYGATPGAQLCAVVGEAIAQGTRPR